MSTIVKQEFLIPFYDMCPVCGESESILFLGTYHSDDLEHDDYIDYFVICLSCGFYNDQNSDGDFIWLGWFNGEVYDPISLPPHNGFVGGGGFILETLNVDIEDPRYGVDYTMIPYTNAQYSQGATATITFTLANIPAENIYYKIDEQVETQVALLSHGAPVILTILMDTMHSIRLLAPPE